MARETIRYEALVLQVGFLAGGELSHSTCRRLSDRGWGLYIEKRGTIDYIRPAADRFQERLGKIWDLVNCLEQSLTRRSPVLFVSDPLSPIAEYVRVMSQDRTVRYTRSTFHALSKEYAKGELNLSLEVRATGMHVPEPIQGKRGI